MTEAMKQARPDQARLTRLVRIQVVVAVAALLLTLGAAFNLPPLIERKAQLEKDIVTKQEELVATESALAAKQDELEALTQLVNKDTLREEPQQPPPELIEESLLRGLKEAGLTRTSLSEVDSPNGFVVVLGSYRSLDVAARNLKKLAPQFPGAGLYWAVNEYFAVALGVFENSSDAREGVQRARAVISDAYVYTAWAFPYEITLEAENSTRR